MSLLDTATAPRSKRKKKSKSKRISQAEAERRERQRQQSYRQDWRAAGLPPPIWHNAPPFPRVLTWLQWVELRGLSLSTAERLEKAGKIKTVRLSARRKGVTEDEDRRYLEACAKGRP
jgi:hypothetical protein